MLILLLLKQHKQHCMSWNLYLSFGDLATFQYFTAQGLESWEEQIFKNCTLTKEVPYHGAVTFLQTRYKNNGSRNEFLYSGKCDHL